MPDKLRIAIDAGHGGRDPGACFQDLKEAVLNERIADRIGHYVRLAGHESVFTRSTTLIMRGAKAVREQCDAFVSIHVNAFTNPLARGTEMFVRSGDKRSRQIAERILRSMILLWISHPEPGNAPHWASRGVKNDTDSQHKGGLAVLKGTWSHMPAMLWEVAFITNPNDRQLLTNRFFVERISCEFANALLVQLDLPTGGLNHRPLSTSSSRGC